ncbi:MAG: DUF2520 domain-containing protein [Rikenellaceae bacterium]
MKRVVIVGGGNLAESVALALVESQEVELVQIYLRRAERGAELSALVGVPYSTFEGPLAAADIYLLAVSDQALAQLSSQLDFAPGAVVAHTAGSSSIEVLDERVRRAVFYPMQTFTAGRRVDFAAIPIFVEAADRATLAELEWLAGALGCRSIELDSESRRRLHLSAVFACNFVNAMFIAGEELVAESGLPFEILKPLIEECCFKAIDAPSARPLQTGPAVRGDQATMARHEAMLSPELKTIYQNISKYIWETSKKI